MITTYSFKDPTGFHRVGGCQSTQTLHQILQGYNSPVTELVVAEIPRAEYDDWRDAKNPV